MLPSILTPEILVFAMNFAAVSVMVSFVALLVTAVSRRHLTLQYGLLCAALGMTMASPILLWIVKDSSPGICRVSFRSPQATGTAQLPVSADPEKNADPQGPGDATKRPENWRASGLEASIRERTPIEPTLSRDVDSSSVLGRVDRHGDSLITTVLSWIVLVWGVVSALLAIRLALAIYRLNHIRHCLRDTTDKRLIAATKHVEEVVGLARPLRVCETPNIAAPVSLGFWRPVVVMPEGLARMLDTAQLLAVIFHESAHVERHDPCVALLQKLSQTIFWWNPLIHFINGRIARLRELICDDFAVRQSGDGAALGEAIVRTAEWSTRPRPTWALTPMLLDQEDELEHRVIRLSQEKRVLASAMGGREFTTLAVFTFLILSGMLVPLFQTQRTLPAARVFSVETGNAPVGDQLSESAVTTRTKTAEIHEALSKAVSFLKGQQRPDGSWPEFTSQPGGLTALCTWALLKSGIPSDDASIQRALEYLRMKQDPKWVYSTALRTMVFCTAEPRKDRPRIKELAQFLRETQVTGTIGPNARRVGCWGYSKRQGVGDNSNMQFAAMALNEAERVGLSVDREVWHRLRAYLLDSQNKDGSWGYRPGRAGTGSMTCGALASLVIAARNCDDDKMQDRFTKAIEAGTRWLAKHFTVETNPKSDAWHIYYLEILARAGTTTGHGTIGDHDWYREGAAALLKRQDAVSGSWTGSGRVEQDPLIATSFALLFLSHGADR